MFTCSHDLYLDEFLTYDSVEEAEGAHKCGLEAQANGENRDGEHGIH